MLLIASFSSFAGVGDGIVTIYLAKSLLFISLAAMLEWVSPAPLHGHACKLTLC